MFNLSKAVVQICLMVVAVLAAVLFRRTIKSFFVKHVKPAGVKVVTAFQTGL